MFLFSKGRRLSLFLLPKKRKFFYEAIYACECKICVFIKIMFGLILTKCCLMIQFWLIQTFVIDTIYDKECFSMKHNINKWSFTFVVMTYVWTKLKIVHVMKEDMFNLRVLQYKFSVICFARVVQFLLYIMVVDSPSVSPLRLRRDNSKDHIYQLSLLSFLK